MGSKQQSYPIVKATTAWYVLTFLALPAVVTGAFLHHRRRKKKAEVDARQCALLEVMKYATSHELFSQSQVLSTFTLVSRSWGQLVRHQPSLTVSLESQQALDSATKWVKRRGFLFRPKRLHVELMYDGDADPLLVALWDHRCCAEVENVRFTRSNCGKPLLRNWPRLQEDWTAVVEMLSTTTTVLTTLSLCSINQYQHAAPASVLANLPTSIRKLTLNSIDFGEDPHLRSIIRLLNLTYLDMNMITCGLASEAIAKLAKLGSLHTLRLSVSRNGVDMADLAALTQLRQLSLEGCSTLRNTEALSSLVGLTSLHIKHSMASGTMDLSGVSQMPQLRTLRLFDSGEVALNGLDNCQKLSLLELMTKIRPGDFNIIGRLSALEHLELNDANHKLCGLDALSKLAKLRSLHTLKLRSASYNDVYDLVALAALTQLRQLSLEGCSTLRNTQTMSSLVRLTSLHMTDSRASGTMDLSGVSHMPQLQTLRLYDSGDVALNGLDMCQRLSSLELRSSQLQPSDFNAIGRLSALQHLELRDMNCFGPLPSLGDLLRRDRCPCFLDVVIPPLKHLSNLRRLDLQLRLRADQGMSDELVECIARNLHALVHLRLKRVSLGEAGIQKLRQMPNLIRLEINPYW